MERTSHFTSGVICKPKAEAVIIFYFLVSISPLSDATLHFRKEKPE